VGDRELPLVRAWAVAVRGRGTTARAVRATALAAAWLRRSQLAVEAPGRPVVGPGGAGGVDLGQLT
jgi:hypothetical protein